jgi:hypothetical protein
MVARGAGNEVGWMVGIMGIVAILWCGEKLGDEA